MSRLEVQICQNLKVSPLSLMHLLCFLAWAAETYYRWMYNIPNAHCLYLRYGKHIQHKQQCMTTDNHFLLVHNVSGYHNDATLWMNSPPESPINQWQQWLLRVGWETMYLSLTCTWGWWGKSDRRKRHRQTRKLGSVVTCWTAQTGTHQDKFSPSGVECQSEKCIQCLSRGKTRCSTRDRIEARGKPKPGRKSNFKRVQMKFFWNFLKWPDVPCFWSLGQIKMATVATFHASHRQFCWQLQNNESSLDTHCLLLFSFGLYCTWIVGL